MLIDISRKFIKGMYYVYLSILVLMFLEIIVSQYYIFVIKDNIEQ